MADIVLGIGSSHSPLLNSPAEDYSKHAEIDRSGRKLLDRDGNVVSYAALEQERRGALGPQLEMHVLRERAAACEAHIDYLASVIEDSALDALIVIGDDQNEQYGEDNMPAIMVYWGESIVNNPLSMPEHAPAFWRKARSQYHEAEAPREYPVAHQLGRHVINALMDDGFDISQSRRLSDAHGEGHAFGFVHRRLMRDAALPILPVALNTYFPPNQPRPARCFALGRALRQAVVAWDSPARVGIVASGGLSHFTVDEELDQFILQACRDKDAAALSGIDPCRLNSGTSEIRNWITTAGAVEHLDTVWQQYVPCYRSEAGTGCGMAFAVWR